MLKFILSSCFAAFALLGSVVATAEIAIIPKPQHLELGQGDYRLDAHAGIVAPDDARAQEIAAFLRDAIQTQTGIALSGAGGIELAIDPSVKGDEAYRLAVTPHGVTIRAASDRGLFWGVQTLRQLLPAGQATTIIIPAVRIDDAPTFGYRGFMLDVGRHFYPVSFVKKQLDLLSYYKINTFHWHLTEDQGWRIEIKRYPKLTEVGAWRTEDDGSRYGGFYTQDQIRDVVDYARQRNIMVIPEIEMPGHSSAALVAYPELSCNKQPSSVPATWGVFKDIDCVGNDGTFNFLQNVLDEVVTLFPAPYLHIGGDETPKDRWHDCASCQALMHAQGLKDEEGLQSYFIKRVQRYLAGKGKTLVGWDEILEGGADKNAVIEMWRGDDEARKALANGNRVIIAGPFYIDSPLDKLTGRDIYRTSIVGTATAAQRAQILGAEAPLWSEHANPFNAESKMYPRLQAFAENLWHSGTSDNAAYADFQHRLQQHLGWLDTQHVAYGPAQQLVVSYTIAATHDGGWQVQAKRGFDDLHNHYTVDGSEPTAQSPSFDDTLMLKQPGTLQVVPFRDGLRYDNATRMNLMSNLAQGRPIHFVRPASSKYAPGDVLVDGVAGGSDFHDGRWAAWHDDSLDAIIDLQRELPLHYINAGFLLATQSRILLPQRVTFSISSDGKHWTRLYSETPAADLSSAVQRMQQIIFKSTTPVSARYVRIEAEKSQASAAAFSGGNKNTWLFADEILIQ